MNTRGSAGRLLIASCIFIIAIAVDACTANDSENPPGTSTKPPSKSASFNQEELRSMAQKRLRRVTGTEKLVAAGSGKIEDSGKSISIPRGEGEIRFEVACSGSGSFDIMRTTRKPHAGDIPTVECGKEAQTFTFKSGNLVEVTLRAYSGTSGVAAWQFVQER